MNTVKTPVMAWVLRLPELDHTTRKMRDDLQVIVDSADEIDKQIAVLAATASERRGEAYRKSLNLESHIRGQWASACVNRLKENF